MYLISTWDLWKSESGPKKFAQNYIDLPGKRSETPRSAR